MQQHFRVLGWLWLVFGAIGVGLALVFLFVGGVIRGTPEMSAGSLSPSSPTMNPMIMFVSALLAQAALIGAVSLMTVAAGAGLLKRKSWARTLTIIVSILSLPGVPFWTALGVYGLWVMFSAEGTHAWAEYVQKADASSSVPIQ